MNPACLHVVQAFLNKTLQFYKLAFLTAKQAQAGRDGLSSAFR